MFRMTDRLDWYFEDWRTIGVDWLCCILMVDVHWRDMIQLGIMSERFVIGSCFLLHSIFRSRMIHKPIQSPIIIMFYNIMPLSNKTPIINSLPQYQNFFLKYIQTIIINMITTITWMFNLILCFIPRICLLARWYLLNNEVLLQYELSESLLISVHLLDSLCRLRNSSELTINWWTPSRTLLR